MVLAIVWLGLSLISLASTKFITNHALSLREAGLEKLLLLTKENRNNSLPGAGGGKVVIYFNMKQKTLNGYLQGDAFYWRIFLPRAFCCFQSDSPPFCTIVLTHISLPLYWKGSCNPSSFMMILSFILFCSKDKFFSTAIVIIFLEGHF
jgi:hypothetical protein